MYECANYLDQAEHMKFYGVQSKNTLDWSVLKQNRDAYILRLNNIYDTMLSKCNIFKGQAQFLNNKQIQVNDQILTYDNLIIAVGNKPLIDTNIQNYQLAESSDDFFKWEEQPKSCVVIGGSYIALELAQILHSYGTKVIQLVRSDILTMIDDDVRDILKKEIHHQTEYKTKVIKLEKLENNQIKVYTDKNQEFIVDKVISAIGRTLNDDNLGLEKTDIQIEKGYIKVNQQDQTNVENIYSIGDCSTNVKLTPVAIRAGRFLVERLFNNQSKYISYDNVPSIIFSHPPTGYVGLSEKKAREQYSQINIHKSEFYNGLYSMNPDKETRSKSYFKLICDSSDHILGIQMIGRCVDEMLQGFSLCVTNKLHISKLHEIVAIHPTASEEMVLMDFKI